jgi:hypothetical protein
MFRFCSISAKTVAESDLRDTVSGYGGVHGPLGQLKRLGKMTAIGLGVRCQCQSKVLLLIERAHAG